MPVERERDRFVLDRGGFVEARLLEGGIEGRREAEHVEIEQVASFAAARAHMPAADRVVPPKGATRERVQRGLGIHGRVPRFRPSLQNPA
ncbi:hypothetical protein GCM10011324_11940 [Allosediminivita pacifica]|nr:hypothetical protein GCM10011324_11940 [Allosediminivita pacifica]